MADETKNDSTPLEQVVWVGSDGDRILQTDNPAPDAPEPTPAPPSVSAPAETTVPEALPTNDVGTKNQSKVLAQAVVSTFTDRLKEEAEKRGGYLTVGDIDQLSQQFDRKREALEEVFQQSFEQYVRIRERAAFDHARKYPFDRVIVNTFAHLFDRHRVAEDGPRSVTRHVLPGFFMALDKMIGPEAMEGYQARSRVIVHRLSKGEESELDWAEIYAEPESKKVCFDALVDFAPYFEDIKKRQEWFLAIANNNLAPENDWELTEGGFNNLVGEMFSSLRDELADPDSRKVLEEKYGGVTCFELDRIFEKMDMG
ncbi:MAG: hypothetical protein HN884_09395 [Rhodospirillaceae bacterium]|nr:hypothetical protein [Rhodospirillaceae bacterium]MBT7267076.1 hypothetical protein [Rhodospirillaceae bacterium]